MLTWTEQSPATSPSNRLGASMAYDAATRNAVLFGGQHPRGKYGGKNLALNDTWTWNGTTWTQQHPATSPGPRIYAAMAYDAATATVVMFGGANLHGQVFNGTWVWDGTTWTKQHPATSPPARDFASMAYDAANGTVVMFGGDFSYSGNPVNDTWTWNGTTWTKQRPATSPPAADRTSMAYDAATGTVVLTGLGVVLTGLSGDHATWVWNGTTWTKKSPATSPPARYWASMAYDSATRSVVLFGGTGATSSADLADTWTWNGTTWTQQHPATSPAARYGASMAYDAATGNVVLFGGGGPSMPVDFADTWIWGSS